MNDQDTINQAYADSLKHFYDVLFQAFLVAAQDQAAQEQAIQRFTAGVALARKVRDAALGAIPG